MENREEALQELYNRVKNSRIELDIKTFRRTPSQPVEQDDLLCVFMTEGTDRVVKPSSRSWLGYPAKREVEIVFELIHVSSFDIRAFFIQFRKKVLVDPKLADNCVVREVRAIGPMSYRTLSDVVGMQLILAMTYMDPGL